MAKQHNIKTNNRNQLKRLELNIHQIKAKYSLWIDYGKIFDRKVKTQKRSSLNTKLINVLLNVGYCVQLKTKILKGKKINKLLRKKERTTRVSNSLK